MHKTKETFPSLPIIATAVYTNTLNRKEVNRLGASDFIGKPLLKEKEAIGYISGHNPKVEEIQNILKYDGFKPGPVDGRMARSNKNGNKKISKIKRSYCGWRRRTENME